MSRGTAESRRRAKARAQTRRRCRYFGYCGNALETYAERHCGICKACQKPSYDPLDEIVRIDALLEAERRGLALPKCSANASPKRERREFWPVAPLRQFHDELVARAAGSAAYEAAASRFGVTARTMSRHLSGDEIALDALERLLSRAGVPLVSLYPEGRETEVEETKTEEVDGRCRTPGCQSARAKGERFCPEHLALLHRVRGEERERSRAIKAKVRRDSRPRCCSPHCQQERTPPSAFCDDCQAAGMVEEVDDV